MTFPWLATVQGAAAVDVAARRGLLDALAADAPVDLPDLLRDLLIGAGVLRRTAVPPELTPSFAAAWRADAAGIAARAAFLVGAAADISNGLEDMLFDLPRFMQGSHTFGLFDYDKALGTTEAHLAATRPWVTYLEALSRHEAPLLAPLIPLRAGDRLLEVGGNTGIMADALCAAHPRLTATVLDLPAVCALGAQAGRRARVRFAAGDVRQPTAFAAFAGQVDVVLFKSVLHDWPPAEVRDMMNRAIEILPPGGRVVVCERGAFALKSASDLRANVLTNLVFAPFYRSHDLYCAIMADAGLSVTQTSVEIDMDFHITTGQRP